MLTAWHDGGRLWTIDPTTAAVVTAAAVATAALPTGL
jgi:hypothetical protein